MVKPITLFIAARQEFFGARRQVKTSPQKLNLVARLVRAPCLTCAPSLPLSLPLSLSLSLSLSSFQIRGMKIRDALAQLEFSPKRAATYVQSVRSQDYSGFV